MNTARRHSHRLSWHRNVPPTFEELEPRQVLSVAFVDSGQSWGSSLRSLDVSLGDLDGDGDLDAFVTSGSATSMINGEPNLVWLNDGSGTFSDSGQALGNSFSNKVALGDVDGDGDLDAWVANGVTVCTGGATGGCPDVFAQPSRVWLNDGTGRFTDSGQALGNAISTSVALGDVDGDGDLDAWVANRGDTVLSRSNRLWLNDGTGMFADSGQALGNSNSQGVALGDLDGDDDLDAWVANSNSHPSEVWLNDGSGTFSRSQVLRSPFSFSVALGDVDGDGDLDAWVANTRGWSKEEPNRVWLNDGSGTFTDSGQALGNSASRDVALGDVDGDGDLDAVAVNVRTGVESAYDNELWLNDGSGTFIDSRGALGSNSRSVELGDVDGDGNVDVWVSRVDTLWLNRSGEHAAGDANRDLQFDQQDIVQVLQAAKYLTGDLATFEEGDWNGDGGFDQFDLIVALRTGNYLQGPYAGLAKSVEDADVDAVYEDVGKL